MSANATAHLEISVDSYCSMAQFAMYVPYLGFTSTDVPTKAQAFQLARATFSETNALLSTVGYKTPVGSGNSTAIRFLANFQALNLASKLELIAASRGGGSVDTSKELQRQYQIAFKQIEDGRITIFNATMADDWQHRRTDRKIDYSFNPDSSNVEQGSTFTRTMDW